MSAWSDAIGAVRTARTQRDDARDALHALQLRALAASRAKQPDRELDARIAAQQKIVAGLETGVRAATNGVLEGGIPQRLIESWDDGLPILRLPLRI